VFYFIARWREITETGYISQGQNKRFYQKRGVRTFLPHKPINKEMEVFGLN